MDAPAVEAPAPAASPFLSGCAPWLDIFPCPLLTCCSHLTLQHNNNNPSAPCSRSDSDSDTFNRRFEHRSWKKGTSGGSG